MKIKPYQSFGPLNFGKTTKEECLQLFGQPLQRGVNREGIEELEYEQFIFRFDSVKLTLHECTLLPYMEAVIEDIAVTWDVAFLREVCKADGAPRDSYGFIVLPSLGIAVTGIHDNDRSQLAITVFSKGSWDDLFVESVPFVLSPS